MADDAVAATDMLGGLLRWRGKKARLGPACSEAAQWAYIGRKGKGMLSMLIQLLIKWRLQAWLCDDGHEWS